MKRNDLCWCGSGKKYKKCHIDFDVKLAEYEREGYELPEHRLILNDEQIECIKKSGVITGAILNELEDLIKPGITTASIDEFVHRRTLEMGGTPATLGYNGYPKSCCTSINEVVCHGIPDETVLKDGDIINVDCTTILDGYFADASKMYLVGDVLDNGKRIVEVAKRSLEVGMAQIKPYEPFANIGRAIEAYANEEGYSVVRHFGGHGIGVNFHEEPHVNHYATTNKGMLMVPGMVFTIEPMINEGTYKVRVLEDDWTAVTTDGKLTAQWEHTLVVTEDGYEILV